MSDKNTKDLRKQLRAVVREILPEILTAELVTASHREYTAKLEERLDAISKHLTDTLTAIDQRSKDMQSYVVRNLPAPPPKS